MREMMANFPIVAAVFAVLCLYSPVLSDEEKPTVTIDFGDSVYYERIRTVYFEMATFINFTECLCLGQAWNCTFSYSLDGNLSEWTANKFEQNGELNVSKQRNWTYFRCQNFKWENRVTCTQLDNTCYNSVKPKYLRFFTVPSCNDTCVQMTWTKEKEGVFRDHVTSCNGSDCELASSSVPSTFLSLMPTPLMFDTSSLPYDAPFQSTPALIYTSKSSVLQISSLLVQWQSMLTASLTSVASVSETLIPALSSPAAVTSFSPAVPLLSVTSSSSPISSLSVTSSSSTITSSSSTVSSLSVTSSSPVISSLSITSSSSTITSLLVTSSSPTTSSLSVTSSSSTISSLSVTSSSSTTPPLSVTFSPSETQQLSVTPFSASTLPSSVTPSSSSSVKSSSSVASPMSLDSSSPIAPTSSCSSPASSASLFLPHLETQPETDTTSLIIITVIVGVNLLLIVLVCTVMLLNRRNVNIRYNRQREILRNMPLHLDHTEPKVPL